MSEVKGRGGQLSRVDGVVVFGFKTGRRAREFDIAALEIGGALKAARDGKEDSLPLCARWTSGEVGRASVSERAMRVEKSSNSCAILAGEDWEYAKEHEKDYRRLIACKRHHEFLTRRSQRAPFSRIRIQPTSLVHDLLKRRRGLILTIAVPALMYSTTYSFSFEEQKALEPIRRHLS